MDVPFQQSLISLSPSYLIPLKLNFDKEVTFFSALLPFSASVEETTILLSFFETFSLALPGTHLLFG